MNGFRILLAIGLIFFLIGCTPETDTSQNDNNNVNFTNISAKRSIDQSVSNMAKQSLKPYKELKSINAVNVGENLIIAVDVYQNERFGLADIRKKLHKKMEKAFPSHKVKLSTDKKLIIEVDKLEKQIEEGNISREKLKKKVKHLVKLDNEQT
ncbi:YhcN/YlaJ family sporulation lipoprotein [Virgibacillus doumboii]|uniref:YhcN/YlaJ family sporulation lipoprotein n=1 Tax=Virgibacillus doumboii TaxID=2697503 RepID=UPI0013DEDB0B|nr:YhcN/YlaJ family sporulation lipoprotein [Virgibacillus doumboii]